MQSTNHTNHGSDRLDLASLAGAYTNGLTPSDVVAGVYERLKATPINPIWISLTPRDAALARAKEIERIGPKYLPLYGVPFGVKDNIDVAGLPTTAGCPAYSYNPQASATVVRRLEEAGAIVIGKTNLDQFATGLVGVRTPYGACSCVFDDRYIAGGSSSGSAVAVAKGLVSFALGTDTAGSGRVPAAFNNLIGLKPTRGAISTRGVVPACRSLDCVSIFALTSGDAHRVLQIARGFDPADPYSRAQYAVDAPAPWLAGGVLPWSAAEREDLNPLRAGARFGVPRPDQLEFFGDDGAAKLFAEAVEAFAASGGEPVEFDLQPFLDAAALLYAGPWVAERLAVLQPFLEAHADAMWPTVREIVEGSAKYTAVDAYRAAYRLAELRRVTEETWRGVDVLLLPTTGTIYTLEDVGKDPIGLNANLGRYTNFVNLLDLAAVALPAGFRPNGLPFGVTLIGQAGVETALLVLADRLHRGIAGNDRVGAGLCSLSETPIFPLFGEEPNFTSGPPGCTLLAVVGAHLTGQPLNGQLTDRGARLVARTRTTPGYRLYALPNTTPPKPGLVHVPELNGPGIEVEVWAIPTDAFGSFVGAVPPPLGIGSVELVDGSTVKGFICEPYALDGARDITEFGGWRSYLQA